MMLSLFFSLCLGCTSGVSVCRLLGAFAKFSIQSKTEEHKDGAEPLHRAHDVTKQNNGAEDGEELPRGGYDGAGQRSKVYYRHKDEGLA